MTAPENKAIESYPSFDAAPEELRQEIIRHDSKLSPEYFARQRYEVGSVLERRR
jgi:hypothetical protein